jgi:carbamoyl-phosphate synthase large subunit
LTIILTAIGKRVELIKHLKTKGRVVGVDSSDLNVGRYFTDEFYIVPKASQTGYIDALLEVCIKEKADFIIPLHEAEFDILCENRKRFDDVGTKLVLSDKTIIDICKDKNKTSQFFDKYDIEKPIVYDKGRLDLIKYPVIVKPADGMGSMGVFASGDEEDLSYALKKTGNPIIQELIAGTEYTMDVLCDMNGEIVYIIPRERLEVRDGEVNKSKVVLDDSIVKLSQKVVNALRQEGTVRGPLTLQCFKMEDGTLKMLEINPRFGGGVPLSFAAGADYADALLAMCEKRTIDKKSITSKTMLRFDDSLFI